jgi:hypothetical protein
MRRRYDGGLMMEKKLVSRLSDLATSLLKKEEKSESGLATSLRRKEKKMSAQV